jgi:acetyltransferase-like isoleucine patch superfamily enzyme
MKHIIRFFFNIYFSHTFQHLGYNTKINPTSWINTKKQISIGHDCFIGKWCHISIVEPATLTIGNYVGISPYVKIFGGDHNYGVVGKWHTEVKEGGDNIPIVIEDDVSIGAGAIILKGIKIGEGAVVAAGAVVTKSIPPYTIWGGNPARKIGTRFSRGDLARHLEIIGSKYKIEDLEQYFPA